MGGHSHFNSFLECFSSDLRNSVTKEKRVHSLRETWKTSSLCPTRYLERGTSLLRVLDTSCRLSRGRDHLGNEPLSRERRVRTTSPLFPDPGARPPRLRSPPLERRGRRATRPELWSACARPRACAIVLAHSRATDMLSGASAISDVFMGFLLMEVMPGTSARRGKSRPCQAHPRARVTPHGFAFASRDRYRGPDSQLSVEMSRGGSRLMLLCSCRRRSSSREGVSCDV